MISGVNSNNWRYISSKNIILWNTQPIENDKIKVDAFLEKRGIKNCIHKNMYNENIEQTTEPQQNNTFKMYHGGTKWTRIPREILGSKKNRYEGGVGIYFTNSYNTARQYAKGSKVVHLVELDKNYTDISKITLKLKDVIEFVSKCNGMKHKSDIITDLKNNASRRNVDFINADVLNNLIINYEAGAGKVGIEVAKYFVNNGIDGSLTRHSGDEFWMVVFNPYIIKKIQIIDPKTVNSDFDYMLPVFTTN
jgi:hypothetical protein